MIAPITRFSFLSKYSLVSAIAQPGALANQTSSPPLPILFKPAEKLNSRRSLFQVVRYTIFSIFTLPILLLFIMSVIAVAGGFGDLGSLITDALYETGQHEVYIMSRRVSHCKTPLEYAKLSAKPHLCGCSLIIVTVEEALANRRSRDRKILTTTAYRH